MRLISEGIFQSPSWKLENYISGCLNTLTGRAPEGGKRYSGCARIAQEGGSDSHPGWKAVHGGLLRDDSAGDNNTSVQSQPPRDGGTRNEGGRGRTSRG